MLARNMNKQYSKQAEAARDKAALKLTPGEKQLKWDEDGYSFAICTKILSDHLSWQGPQSAVLVEKQIVSLMVKDKQRGIFLEDMYQVSAEGGQHLTSF